MKRYLGLSQAKNKPMIWATDGISMTPARTGQRDFEPLILS